MTPDDVLACTTDELQQRLGISRETALAKRKRAHNAVWQRKYRARVKPTRSNFWLGYLDGPPIERCPRQESFIENAVKGSAMLKARLNEVFGL